MFKFITKLLLHIKFLDDKLIYIYLFIFIYLFIYKHKCTYDILPPKTQQ